MPGFWKRLSLYRVSPLHTLNFSKRRCHCSEKIPMCVGDPDQQWTIMGEFQKRSKRPGVLMQWIEKREAEAPPVRGAASCCSRSHLCSPSHQFYFCNTNFLAPCCMCFWQYVLHWDDVALLLGSMYIWTLFSISWTEAVTIYLSITLLLFQPLHCFAEW